MKNIFIIPGYGVPKNIFKDIPQRFYLGLVFNYIYQTCLDKKDKSPVIIFTGGPTDILRPYKRTEAGEMKKLFLEFAQRDFVKKQTINWQYKLEKNSLSTVENILESNKIIKSIKVKKQIYIFVEFTRQKKISVFARKIFKQDFKIIPLDFDLSVNRYLEPKFIDKKEAMDIRFGLKSIQDKDFYKKYRNILEDKIKYFRQHGAKKHKDAIYNWWQEKLKELDKIK